MADLSRPKQNFRSCLRFRVYALGGLSLLGYALGSVLGANSDPMANPKRRADPSQTYKYLFLDLIAFVLGLVGSGLVCGCVCPGFD